MGEGVIQVPMTIWDFCAHTSLSLKIRSVNEMLFSLDPYVKLRLEVKSKTVGVKLLNCLIKSLISSLPWIQIKKI